LRLCL